MSIKGHFGVCWAKHFIAEKGMNVGRQAMHQQNFKPITKTYLKRYLKSTPSLPSSFMMSCLIEEMGRIWINLPK